MEIIINGVNITHDQALTIQLALYHLAKDLENGLFGDYGIIKRDSECHLDRIGDILELMRKNDNTNG